MQIVDVRDPAAPALHTRSGGAANSLHIAGNLLYVAGKTLDVMDVRDPGAPVLLGSAIVGSPGAHGLAVEGGFAYTGSGIEQRLVIVDVADPTRPRRVAGVYTPGRVSTVAVAGGVAFMADSYSPRGVQIADVTVPRPAALLSAMDLGEHSSDFVARGRFGYLIIRDQELSLRVVDLTDPRAPKPRGGLATGYPGRIAASDKFVLMTHERFLDVIDATDPDAPVRLSSVEVGANPTGLAATDDLAFVTSGQELRIYGMQTPASPQLASVLAFEDSAVTVRVSGHHAFVSVSNHGLQIVDIADPGAPGSWAPRTWAAACCSR